MQITYPLTIYYDAACPMCRTEMETLKEMDFDNKLILVDCSNTNMDAPASCLISHEAMMERIYAQDAAGQWLKGVDVFEAAYAAAGFKALSKLWGSQTLRPVLDCIYPLIADNRHWLSKTPLPFWFNGLLRLNATKQKNK